MIAQRRTLGRLSILATVVACVMVTAAPAVGQVATYATSWSNHFSTGSLTLNSDTNAVRVVTFTATSFPSSAYTIQKAVNAGPDASLAGDYTSAGAQHVRFWLTVTGAPIVNSSGLFLQGTSGRFWYRQGLVTNENSVLLDRVAGGWVIDTDKGTGTLDDKWSQDLQSVAGLHVYIEKNTGMGSLPTRAQQYVISDFRVLGTGVIGGSSLSPLMQALQERFGVTNVTDVTDEEAMADTDSDGMTDLDEIRAQHEPGYFSTIFMAEIVNVEGSVATLKWPCVQGKQYRLIKATGLMQADFSEIASGIAASETGYMTYDDANAGGEVAYYYVEQNP